MAKEWFVIRGGRVVYTPGHYDRDGAEAVAKLEIEAHPKSLVYIVRVVGHLTGRESYGSE